MPLSGLQETFLTAIREGNSEAVDRLLTENPGFDINFAEDEGMTPLHAAVEKNYFSIVARLLEVPGIDLEMKTRLEKIRSRGGKVVESYFVSIPALHCAAKNGDLKVVNLLLAKGANVHALASDGCTALWAAAGSGHVEVAKVLLTHGANAEESLESKWDKNGFTPLLAAVNERRGEMVSLLLQWKANVYAESRTTLSMSTHRGRTVLGIALQCTKGYEGCKYDEASLYLDCFYRILWHLEDQFHPSCETALPLPDVDLFVIHADFLFKHKDFITQGKEEFRVLMMMRRAIESHSHSPFGLFAQLVPGMQDWMRSEITARCIHTVADAKTLERMQIEYKKSLAEWLRAAATPNIDMLSGILAAGIITVDAEDEKGRTALYVAAENGCEENVLFLLERRARADIICRRFIGRNFTALGIAFEKNHNDCGFRILRYLSIAQFETHPDRDIVVLGDKTYLSHLLSRCLGDPISNCIHGGYFNILKYLDYVCPRGREACALDVVCSFSLPPSLEANIQDSIRVLLRSCVFAEAQVGREKFSAYTIRYRDYITWQQLCDVLKTALSSESTYHYAQFFMQLPIVKENVALVWDRLTLNAFYPSMARFSQELLAEHPALLRTLGLKVCWNTLHSQYSYPMFQLLLEENDKRPPAERFDVNATKDGGSMTLLLGVANKALPDNMMLLLIEHGADIVRDAFYYLDFILHRGGDVGFPMFVENKLLIVHRLLKFVKPDTELSDAQWKALDNLLEFIEALPDTGSPGWKENLLKVARDAEKSRPSILSCKRRVIVTTGFFTSAEPVSFLDRLETNLVPREPFVAPTVSVKGSLN